MSQFPLTDEELREIGSGEWRRAQDKEQLLAELRGLLDSIGLLESLKPDGMQDVTGTVDSDELVRPVTIAEYFARDVQEVRDGKRAPPRLSRSVAKLIVRAQLGDRWWKWMRGTEPGMQMGGIALVRDGDVVWARMDWIS